MTDNEERKSSLSRFWSGSSSSSSSLISTASDNTFCIIQDKDGLDSQLLLSNDEQITSSDLIYHTPPPKKKTNPNPDLAWSHLQSSQRFESVLTEVGRPYDPLNSTRIVLMSDTHGKHRELGLPPKGDILIHGGDFTNTGEESSVRDLSAFFKECSALLPKIVCIAGNHELTFHESHYEEVWRNFHYSKKLDSAAARSALENCVYLEDQSYIYNSMDAAAATAGANNSSTSGELKIYGTPWQPVFHDWAFNLPRGDACRERWEAIPTDTDILITHGPPLGRGDRCLPHGNRAGCVDLLEEVQDRIKPRIHIFGHIHEGYGVTSDGTTIYVNASNVALNYQTGDNPYIVLDIPKDGTKPVVKVDPCCDACNDTKEDVMAWLRKNDSPQGGGGTFRSLLRYFESTDIDGNDMLNAPFEDLYRRLGIASRQGCNVLRKARALYRTSCYK